MALRKPSDLFGKNNEENNNTNTPVVETDNSLREELTKVESLSEQLSQLQQELTQKVVQTDLEKLVLSHINTMQENFAVLQEEFQQSNERDISKFRETVSQLGDVVGNLVENEIPKYKKQITSTDIRIGEKFNEFKEVVEENIADIREDVETKVENIASAIDDNLEYFNQQLQETSSGVKKTVDTYNKLSKIVESRIEKENGQLEEYSKIIQSLHEEFIALEASLQEEVSVSRQKVEEQIETYKNEITSEQLLSEKKLEIYKNELEISVDNLLENYQKELKDVKADVVINEQHLKKVEKFFQQNHQELLELKEEVYGDIEKLPFGNIQENIQRLEKKIDFIRETYSKIEPEVIVKEVIKEGLAEPPSTKNEDPLTPLDQNFVTLDQLQEHYRLFINRIQQQLSTLGGGGETQLKYLDDIVGIATNASAYDGKYLKYNHSLGKFEFDNVDITNDSWSEGINGPYTNGSVGIGTSVANCELDIIGNVCVTGVVTATDFNSLSDLKLKENVEIISSPIDSIMKIEGVNFNWKETGKLSMGVIAQQLEETLPQLISGEEIKTVNYNGLIGLLIEVVKDQQKQIDELKRRLDK